MKDKIEKKETKKVSYEPYRRVPKKEFTRAIHNCGDRYIYRAKLSINDKGDKKAEPGEKVDWRAFIQSSEKSCDLHNIIQRYLSGDATVINVNPSGGYSGDIAALPKNVNDIQDLGDRVQKSYSELDPEIKNIFNNNFEEFYNSVLKNEVETKIKGYLNAKIAALKNQIKEAKE